MSINKNIENKKIQHSLNLLRGHRALNLLIQGKTYK